MDNKITTEFRGRCVVFFFFSVAILHQRCLYICNVPRVLPILRCDRFSFRATPLTQHEHNHYGVEEAGVLGLSSTAGDKTSKMGKGTQLGCDCVFVWCSVVQLGAMKQWLEEMCWNGLCMYCIFVAFEDSAGILRFIVRSSRSRCEQDFFYSRNQSYF